MSVFDLAHVIESLRSSKAKARSDALKLLSDYSFENLKLSNKQFSALYKSIVKAVEDERDTKTITSTASQRITTSLTILYELTEYVLHPGSPNRPRSKTLGEFSLALMAVYRSLPLLDTSYDMELLLPIISSKNWIAKILALLLRDRAFFTHLTQDTWMEHHTYCTWAISTELAFIENSLDDFSNNTRNEKLLIELFIMLATLVGVESSYNVVSLTYNQAYQALLDLFLDTLHYFRKRESALHVWVLKITNKLLILLATEDIQFSHALITMGINVALQFATTSTEMLIFQINFFLNIDFFHYYVSLDIIPPDSLSKINSLSGKTTSSKTQLYQLEQLINIQVKLAQAQKIRLLESDIEVVSSPRILDWYYLRTAKLCTENYNSWLGISGIAKLLITHYRISSRQSITRCSGELVNYLNFRSLSGAPGAKRHKPNEMSEQSTAICHIMDFVLNMIQSADAKEQICGLQISIFLLEYAWEDKLEDILQLNFLELFEAILQLVPEHPFWALLACRLIVIVVTFVLPTKTSQYVKGFRELLRISTSFIRNKAMYRVASELLLALLDHPCNKSNNGAPLPFLEEIILSPVINGPPQIDYFACIAWYSVSKLYNATSLNSRKKFYLGLSTWITHVSKISRNSTSKIDFNSLSFIKDLMCWLLGKETVLRAYTSSTPYVPQFSYKETEQRKKLVSFICLLPPVKEAQENSKARHYPRLTVPSDVILGIMTKVNDEFAVNSKDSGSDLVILAIILAEISLICEKLFPSESLTLKDKATDLILSSSQEISLRYEANIVISALISLSPTRVALDELNFPFEVIDYRLTARSLSKAATSNTVTPKAPSYLEEEFSQTDSIVWNSSLTTEDQETGYNHWPYFLFLIKFEDQCYKKAFQYLSNLTPEAILGCVEQYLEQNQGNLASNTEDQDKIILKLLRILGERCLSIPEFERDFRLLILCCKLLQVLMEKAQNPTRSDCDDLINYIFYLEKSKLILSEECLIQVAKLKLLVNKPSKTNFSFTGFNVIATDLSNNSEFIITESCASLLVMRPNGSSEFADFCSAVDPSHDSCSLELEVVSCFNVLYVATQLKSYCTPAIQYFTTLLSYVHLSPYIKLCLHVLAQINNERLVSQLLKRNGLPILKTWYMMQRCFDMFPFDVFMYESRVEFYKDNFQAIICITHAISGFDTGRDNILDIPEMSLITGIKESELWKSCLPLATPLAYTKNGLKNEFSHTMARQLKNKYTPLMRELLSLTILETFQMTDYSDETELAKAAAKSPNSRLFNSAEILKEQLEVIISPDTSFCLITTLIERYHHGASNFWNEAILYFILRRLSVSNFGSSRIKIRSLKFAICISNFDFEPTVTSSLLLEICADLIHSELVTDALELMQMIDFDALTLISGEWSVSIITLILSKIFKYSEIKTTIPMKKILKKLYELLSRQTKSLPFSKSVLSFLEQTVLFIENRPQYFEICLLENFLADELVAQIMNSNEESIFIIVSALFPFVSIKESSKGNRKLISLFLNYKFDQKSVPNFKAKVAEYLGNYYLDEIPLSEIKDFAFRQEANRHGQLTIENNLNSILDFLKKESRSKSMDVRAVVECTIGVLVNCQRSELLESLLPISILKDELGFETLSLLIDLLFYLYPDAKAKQVTVSEIDNFEYPVSEEKFEIWNFSIFAYSLEHSGLGSSSIAAITSLSSWFPRKISSLIPIILCRFLSSLAAKGDNFVFSLIESFCTSPGANCFDSINLIKDIILQIRVRALEGQRVFEKLYRKLNLRNIFSILKDSIFVKSALLILEDYVGSLKISNYLTKFDNDLSQIYISLDEIDLFAGLPEKGNLNSSLELLKFSATSHELLQYESAKLDANSALHIPVNTEGVSSALLQDGLASIPMLFADSSQQRNASAWAWKLDHWDIPCKVEQLNKDEAIYSYFYQLQNYQVSLTSAFRSLTSELFDSGREWELNSFKKRCNSITQFFETLGIIVSVKDILETPVEDFEVIGTRSSVWESWNQKRVSLDVIQARIIAFANHNALKSKDFEANQSAFKAQLNELICYNDRARLEGLQQKVLNSMVLLEKIINDTDRIHGDLKKELCRRSVFQAAKAFWMQGKSDLAIAMINDLLQKGSIEINYNDLSIDKVLIDAYKVKWMSEAHFDSGSNLLHNYVEPSILQIENVTDLSQKEEVYRLYASFCEDQSKSKQLTNKIKELVNRINLRKQEAEDIKVHYGKRSVTSAEKKKVQKYYSGLKLQIAAQTKELEVLLETRRSFQSHAADFYLKSLLLNSKGNNSDKFFSLILEQASDLDLQKVIEQDLLQLSSLICVNWVTQLLSRISTEESVFQTSIQNLIFRVCVEHPFHSLYYLISLEYHEELAEENDNLAMSLRVSATKKIHQRLLTCESNYIDKVLNPIVRFCQECVGLAQHKAAKSRVLMLDKLKLGNYWIETLPQVPPPTYNLPLSSCGYKDVPVMVLINAKVAVATSGISLPKIATFVLSNGKIHKMLLKYSSDDIRQDAIMEQVFDKVNGFLSRDEEARRRSLAIRTYRAVPLGPKAGVIEFVADTSALIDIIRPFHQKQDAMKIEEARNLMKEAQYEDFESRIKVFRGITSKIEPVLRKYFLHQFRDPDSWYESRLAYTRGVATTLMVGHILGLGDRHCNNILIDGATGEPVHIDLGVAFDQGKRLPIPESVPFRLTRDMVDGFGITKTRGLFSKSCERTLEVLRTNEAQITSILDVLRWDPLYSWSISPLRMRRLQETAGDDDFKIQPVEDGSEAATAIITVKEKLNAGGLSVSAAVRDLIAEATDEKNLAVIYCGWCPFY